MNEETFNIFALDFNCPCSHIETFYQQIHLHDVDLSTYSYKLIHTKILMPETQGHSALYIYLATRLFDFLDRGISSYNFSIINK